jgi:hypothetical protein
MSTAFAQLTDFIRDLLVQTPALASGNVYRGRLRPMPAEQTEAIVVRLGRSAGDTETLMGDELAWSTIVNIDIFKRVPADEDPEDAIDPLLQAVALRIAQATAPAGVTDVRPFEQINWEFDEADTTLACATVTLVIQHNTNSTDFAPAA